MEPPFQLFQEVNHNSRQVEFKVAEFVHIELYLTGSCWWFGSALFVRSLSLVLARVLFTEQRVLRVVTCILFLTLFIVFQVLRVHACRL